MGVIEELGRKIVRDLREAAEAEARESVQEGLEAEALECPACSGPVYHTAIRCEACGMTSSTIHGFGGT